ncbi:MAG: hypothetical protein QF440_01440 [Candidatus Thalassarchaeaceae archaeon]|jgi:hypothetical protein|nr:hypothetical protein [Candidatus Thalassarchaeaceae archaeon]
MELEDDEEERVLIDSDNFLASQVSFDIDSPQQPKRKIKKAKGETTSDSENDAVSSCPGCGKELLESEFVDAMLSFVTGATDYLAGDPVRVRSVQILQQIVSEGRLPDPHSEWSIEVVQRLEQHIEHMADERARVIARQGNVGNDSLNEQRIRNEAKETMRAEIEQEIVGEVALAIREQIRQQTLEEMVPQIRAELETEMWEQFEEILRAERAKNKSN